MVSIKLLFLKYNASGATKKHKASEMLSLWLNFYHKLHREFSKWQPPVEPVCFSYHNQTKYTKLYSTHLNHRRPQYRPPAPQVVQYKWLSHMFASPPDRELLWICRPAGLPPPWRSCCFEFGRKCHRCLLPRHPGRKKYLLTDWFDWLIDWKINFVIYISDEYSIHQWKYGYVEWRLNWLQH